MALRARLGLLAVLAAALAGCGEEATKEPAPGTAPDTRLEVSVWATGKDGKVARRTVDCAQGTAAECTRLRALKTSAFAPVPGDRVCTAQIMGPDVAEVTGTLRGRPVEGSFSLTNGCEIARWQNLDFLLGKP